MALTIILVISVIIILAVIWLTVITTNKAYAFKHTVDQVDPIPPGYEDISEKEEGK